MNILIATTLTDDSLQLLHQVDNIELQVVPPSLPTVREAIHKAHAIIARDDVLIDRTLLDCAPQLKIIGRVGAGLSGIDIEAATERGIIVMHTPGTSATAAGEHAMTLMLALSRRLIVAHDSLKEGWWLLDRKRQAGGRVRGRRRSCWRAAGRADRARP